jgi:hypothetical protein
MNKPTELTFIHIPKTGGTSVLSALGRSQLMPKHAPARCIEGPYFTVVRNPFSRLASLYRWQCAKQRVSDRGYASERREAGFKRWLLEGKDWLGSDPEGGVYFDGGWKPWHGKGWQASYDPAPPPLQRRPAHWWTESNPHFLYLRFEKLAEDLAVLFPGVDLPHLNASTGPDVEMYDQEMIDFVLDYHWTDFELFEYGGIRS